MSTHPKERKSKPAALAAGEVLTERQRRFVEAFVACGVASQAAVTAGYSAKTSVAQGSRLLTYANVAAAIKAIAKERSEEGASTAAQRRAFWGRVMYSKGASMRDRLRASELAGKAAGDFLERVHVDANITGEVRAQVVVYLPDNQRSVGEGAGKQ